MAVNLKGRSFLTLMDFTPEEIRYMLDLAHDLKAKKRAGIYNNVLAGKNICPVSYTHLRAHETGSNLVCRLLLEKKKYHLNTSRGLSVAWKTVSAHLASS